MDELLGLLRIHVKRGVNLAIRDVNTSDPYVVVKMDKQVTSFIFNHINKFLNFFLCVNIPSKHFF